MREKIAHYLQYHPRNKLIFSSSKDLNIHSIDMGYELSSMLKDHLSSPFLPMISYECFNSLMQKSIWEDKIIGNYIAISNWGILFEPDLKLDLLSLFDAFSINQTLILINCGKADRNNFHLVSYDYKTVLPLSSLNPYIIS